MFHKKPNFQIILYVRWLVNKVNKYFLFRAAQLIHKVVELMQENSFLLLMYIIRKNLCQYVISFGLVRKPLVKVLWNAGTIQSLFDKIERFIFYFSSIDYFKLELLRYWNIKNTFKLFNPIFNSNLTISILT